MNHIRILLLTITLILMPIFMYGQSGKIPIITERNRTVIPVKIENLELKILLDTGMTFDGLMVYNPELLEAINLKSPIKVRVPGAGSGPPSEALMETGGTFFIGEHEFINQKILMLTSDTFSGFPTDGILGYSIFGNYAVEVNYDDKYITLHNFDSLNIDNSWDRIPIYFKNNTIPWIDVKIQIRDENPFLISTYIDFAAGETIELLEKDSQVFTTPDNVESVHLGKGLSGEIYGSNGKISQLIIGDYSLKNINAAFTNAKIRSKQKNADGIIGNGSLRHFNLIFDYKNKYLYLKPNSHF